MSTTSTMARTDQTVKELVTQTAQALNHRQPQITKDMTALLATIDYLDGDRHLMDMLEASIEANVKTVFHVLINHIGTDNLQPTTAAVEYAVRLAQRGIPANSLVRAYHMGQDDLMASCFDEVQNLECDADLKFKVVHYISNVLYSYTDFICLYLLGVYEREQQRWSNVSGNVHAGMVYQLLADGAVSPKEFCDETGYSLNQHHVGIFIWCSDESQNAEFLRSVEESLGHLARRVRCPAPPIFIAVDRGTAWAWFPRGRHSTPLSPDVLREWIGHVPNARMSLGLPSAGPVGFRRTHRQAEAARAVALASSHETDAVVSYGAEGVAVVSVLAQDLESTRAWVHEVLGDLADTTENAERHRNTLRAFLGNGCSFTQTSVEMMLHRNSVKYRVDRAEKMRGRAISVDRLDLELALQVCHALGASVLTDLEGRALALAQ